MNNHTQNKGWSDWAMHILTELERFSTGIEKLKDEVIDNSKETILLQSDIQKLSDSIKNNRENFIVKFTEIDKKIESIEADQSESKIFQTRLVAVLGTINFLLVVIGITTQVIEIL